MIWKRDIEILDKFWSSFDIKLKILWMQKQILWATSNGSLYVFSQAAAPRSKTVILVKNLPANTDPEDLRAVFSKHGALGRIILPPSGITAVVEYLDPTEAKLGFRNLAYTKVHLKGLLFPM